MSPKPDDTSSPQSGGPATSSTAAPESSAQAAAPESSVQAAAPESSAQAEAAESSVTAASGEAATPPSAEAAPTRRTVQASKARRLLALVAIGAVGAAAVTIGVSGGFDRSENLPAPTAQGTSASTSSFGASDAGDCLQWTPTDDPDTDRQDLAEVSCAEPHRFEVAKTVDLAAFPVAEFATGSPYPDSSRFAALRDEHCVAAVQDYTGGRFDPTGRYSVGLMFPSQAGWANGERAIRCGIQQTGATSALQEMVGRVADQDQSTVWDVGTCVGVESGVPTDPVDCGTAHAFEVVSVVDLGAQFPGGLPSVEDQDRYLEPTCTQAADAYLGSPDALRNKTLTLFWDNVDASSWMSGSRKVSCSVGKEVDSGGFAAIVGSAKGDITIDGVVPVPPPPVPDGRSLPTPLPGAAPLPGA
ncbi:septum formation family protein [Rhodococcoides corynebacterioides]|uniref:Septum formation family protein n=1 Tax=Rhodococcoides corynebacterioides TaxID=53972 RepID=A0ABS7PA79_9NOCA|nr:septum formation family protein [Rhodococcus corynebacterioides]MBY6368752.1 septum formation family protein [Rhodococcus corynebacterioides]MBY6409923.1 septum formation family protein [Rhodococcus corynebacterioides]